MEAKVSINANGTANGECIDEHREGQPPPRMLNGRMVETVATTTRNSDPMYSANKFC
jgi:hypothetical protein